MCQLISSQKIVSEDFSYFRVFLPLIMKNVFEKFALYPRYGAETGKENLRFLFILFNEG